ncbi:hypothetical protein NE848_09915 [Gramella jeungdoensis]|uniref:Uncharacterized protein n=1 Tax=Gramella jeungdoensis TaxID=708091 RepID=A0ABT0Z1T7_9FLAO|nr:hypothetical protein [Gramella jeungdoensis]MCM8569696.1 hypothetical protein [Gramella jeungdoensis]
MQKVFLVLIALGIWGIFLQNAGILPTTNSVYVNGGHISAEIQGEVEVENTVDVNLHEINGHRDAFYNNYNSHPDDYYRIPVYTAQ